MGKIKSLLWGAAIGAGLMYFQDPQSGNRRKALVRDQVDRLQRQSGDALDVAVRDLRNRARGLMAEGASMFSNEGLPDYILEERIRSRLGFITPHPRALEVTVQNGAATLSGDILADDVENLLVGLGRVRGIRGVENNLRVHQQAGNIDMLQGEGWTAEENAGMWAPATRLLAGIGGAYLMMYGLVRGGLIGTAAKSGGLYLGTRALANKPLREVVRPGENEMVRVRKSIQINAPVEEVYALWSNFENFSQFMHNIEAIHSTGRNRSHWIVKGPAGSRVEFDAITTENIPNELVAWETTPDSTIQHHGQVSFRPSGRGTQVNVAMDYLPPAGIAGHAVASIFGKDPKSEMDADLARMKSLLETGKTTAGSSEVTRDQVKPRSGVPVTGRRTSEQNTDTDMGLGMGMEGDAGQES